MAKQPDDDSEKRGFAGLGDLISDISTDGGTVQQTEPSQETPTTPAFPSSSPSPSNPSDFSGSKWIFGLIAVVLTIWIFGAVDRKDTSHAHYKPPARNNLSQNHIRKSTRSEAVAPSTVDFVPDVSRPSEEKPPVGAGNVFGWAQIRYCLSENIRIEAMRKLIANTSEREVNSFNSFVSDYNSRCKSFRYRRGTLNSVREEVEARRGSLAFQGKQRIAKWRQHSIGTKTGRTRSSLVRAVQERLTQLGYHPGPADGLIGRRTRSAIKAFQSTAGLRVNGKISNELLQKLEQSYPRS